MRIGNVDRYIKVVESVLMGETFKNAGKAAGVSGKRARNITDKLTAMMTHRTRIKTSLIPKHNRCDVDDLRKHKDFWLDQLKKLRLEYEAKAKTPKKIKIPFKIEFDTDSPPDEIYNAVVVQIVDQFKGYINSKNSNNEKFKLLNPTQESMDQGTQEVLARALNDGIIKARQIAKEQENAQATQ